MPWEEELELALFFCLSFSLSDRVTGFEHSFFQFLVDEEIWGSRIGTFESWSREDMGS